MAVRKQRAASRNQLAKIPDNQRYGVLDLCHDELTNMAKRGSFTDDVKRWHPAKVITHIIESTDNETLKFWCAKELLQYIVAPKAAELRLNQIEGRDFNITIVVPGWAASKADETRDAVTVDVTAPRIP